MKFCPQCGQPGGDDQKFCMKCGADISAAVMGAGPYYPPPAKTNNKTVIIIIAAIALVMAIPVVLIVAAIAIPNLIRAKISANQSSAVASLRVLDTALIQYQATYGHYPTSIAQLGPPLPSGSAGEDHAGLIDGVLAGGMKSGYTFTYESVPGATKSLLDDHGKLLPQQPSDADGFTLHADPTQYDRTGMTYYFTDQTGVIRMETRKQADADSPQLE